MQVRAVVKAQLVADAAPPAGAAIARFGDHAIPGKRRAARRKMLVAVEVAVAPVVVAVVAVPAHAPPSFWTCPGAPSGGVIT